MLTKIQRPRPAGRGRDSAICWSSVPSQQW